MVKVLSRSGRLNAAVYDDVVGNVYLKGTEIKCIGAIFDFSCAFAKCSVKSCRLVFVLSWIVIKSSYKYPQGVSSRIFLIGHDAVITNVRFIDICFFFCAVLEFFA